MHATLKQPSSDIRTNDKTRSEAKRNKRVGRSQTKQRPKPKKQEQGSRRRLHRPPPPPPLLPPPLHRRLNLHRPRPMARPPFLPLLVPLHLDRAILAVHLGYPQHRHTRSVNAAGLLPALGLVFVPAAGAGGGGEGDGGEFGAVVGEGGGWEW